MNSLVGGDGTGQNGCCQVVNNFVVSGGNGSHVGGAMAEDMGEGFLGFAMATGGTSIRTAGFYDIRGYAVEAGSMYEAPVFKTNIESRVMPRRSVGNRSVVRAREVLPWLRRSVSLEAAVSQRRLCKSDRRLLQARVCHSSGQ